MANQLIIVRPECEVCEVAGAPWVRVITATSSTGYGQYLPLASQYIPFNRLNAR
jgi:hypothetical protein